jgi:hypothetical protein
MKLERFSVEIRYKIFLGGYEVIEPVVTQSCVLEGEELKDIEGVRKQIHKVLEEAWVKEALDQLRLVHKVRTGKEPPKDDKVPALMNSLKIISKGDI